MTFQDFAAAHRGPRPLVLPNAWDHASAAALAAAGFAAIGTTSLGVAAAHGLPDGAGATRDQTIALARSLGPLPALITVDIEGGFSDDPEGVAALAAVLTGLGIVGVNLEDGRPDGTLTDPEHHAARIAAVKERCPGLFVNARTDPYWLGTASPLETALARADRYTAAGADGVFVPGATAEDDIRALAEGIAVPLNILYAPGGLSVDRLGALGVARVSTGSLLYRAALTAAVRTAGLIGAGEPVETDQISYAEVTALRVPRG
ncbi:isocitrate lyase/phosphoenolpyruvate mutase family protein [Glycomyces sp. NPDC047010]|uniref:isocitrate lyase/PEP mutase family protein n=1 Tax=Glycomyces sp. NPDC047010 TaxID=3155023 RepID=UPI0033F5E89F